MVIANAAPILAKTAGKLEFFAQNAWIIAAFGGLVNASGRVGTGLYSDKIGRSNAYLANGIVSAVFLLATPFIIMMESVPLLFLATGIAYWQYGGGLALMPSFTADFFGSKHLGANYGLVFLGWGLGFLMPLMAGYIKDTTGSYNLSFYISAAVPRSSGHPQPPHQETLQDCKSLKVFLEVREKRGKGSLPSHFSLMSDHRRDTYAGVLSNVEFVEGVFLLLTRE